MICVARQTEAALASSLASKSGRRRCFLSNHACYPPIFLCRKYLPAFPSRVTDLTDSPSRAYRSLSRRRFPPLAHGPPDRRPELEPHRGFNPQHRLARRAQLRQQRIGQGGPAELAELRTNSDELMKRSSWLLSCRTKREEAAGALTSKRADGRGRRCRRRRRQR